MPYMSMQLLLLNQAIVDLDAGCNTKSLCDASATCKAAIKTVLMYHDTCPEDSLPDTIERALHDYEEPCEDHLCNSASAVFDPYADASDTSEYCLSTSTSSTVSEEEEDGTRRPSVASMTAVVLAATAVASVASAENI